MALGKLCAGCVVVMPVDFGQLRASEARTRPARKKFRDLESHF